VSVILIVPPRKTNPCAGAAQQTGGSGEIIREELELQEQQA